MPLLSERKKNIGFVFEGNCRLYTMFVSSITRVISLPVLRGKPPFDSDMALVEGTRVGGDLCHAISRATATCSR